MYAIGRRKEASAQVRLYKNGKGNIIINKKNFREYFPYFEWQEILLAPLQKVGKLNKLDLSIKVKGGGTKGQAEAARLGISRALVKLDENYKKTLRSWGFLTRDARVKERKKPGLKRARRAPQWQKR